MPRNAAAYDIIIYKGADFSRLLRFLDSDGVAIDLTGATVRAQVRAYAGASAILAEFTCTLAADPTTGECTISLTDTQTTALTPSGRIWSEYTIAAWDLFIDFPTGETVRAMHGKAKISPYVTQVAPIGD